MEAKHLIFAAIFAVTFVHSQGFFLPSQCFSDVLNRTSINGTNLTIADLISSLIANHVAHTANSIETIARIAELLATGGVLTTANATGLAGNFTRGVVGAFENLAEAKLNLTSQAANTIVNASAQLFNYGAQAVQLLPNFALNLANAFG